MNLREMKTRDLHAQIKTHEVGSETEIAFNAEIERRHELNQTLLAGFAGGMVVGSSIICLVAVLLFWDTIL